MEKILLLAYTNKNFGDDMFVRTICEYFPNIHFFIEVPDNYDDVFKECTNLTIIKNSIIKKIAKKVDDHLFNISKGRNCPFRHKWIKKFTAIIYVIGALFDDNGLWENIVGEKGRLWYKNELWLKSLYNEIPFFLLGSNMSRVNSQRYIELMDYVLDGVRDICFRDKYSFEMFSHLSNVRWAPDIVFNYNCKPQKKEKKALISVWGPLTRTESFPQWKWAESWWENYFHFIINAVQVLQKINYEVCLLSLCEPEGDYFACKLVKEKIKGDVEIINYDGNLNVIIETFERAALVVGTRFHSIVMAINSGCAFYPIIYESKSEQLLKDIDYTGPFTNIDSINDENIQDMLNASAECYSINLGALKNDARNQFKKLNEVLEEKHK